MQKLTGRVLLKSSTTPELHRILLVIIRSNFKYLITIPTVILLQNTMVRLILITALLFAHLIDKEI